MSGVTIYKFSRKFWCLLDYGFKSVGFHVILTVSVAFYSKAQYEYCVLWKT